MKSGKTTQSMHEQDQTRLNSPPVLAFFLACTDMWTLFWIGIGLFVTFMPLIFVIGESYGFSDKPPSGAWLRGLIPVASYWLLTTPLALPRYLKTYRIARRGVIVAGTISGLSGTNKTQVDIRYQYGNRNYFGCTGTVFAGDIPLGGNVLVAVDPKKPTRYRVIPNDFRLESSRIQEFCEVLGVQTTRI